MWILLLVVIYFLILLIRFFARKRIAQCNSKEMMTGKVVIVTGANAGIGFEIAKELARRGARVILACRSEHRGLRAAASIASETKNKEVIFERLDLASLNSIRAFCDHILSTEKRLDVLVNNAAAVSLGQLYTSDGIIEEMQVNHFGPFLLTLLLLPLLQKSRPARIVMVSSKAAYSGTFDPNKINKQRCYSNFKTYCNSKLCNVMFCVELSRRLKGVVVNAVHPGTIYTNISKTSTILNRIVFIIVCWFSTRTVVEGAQTPIFLAVAQECETLSGKFFADCRELTLPQDATDKDKCSLLWDLSCKLVGYKEEKMF